MTLFDPDTIGRRLIGRTIVEADIHPGCSTLTLDDGAVLKFLPEDGVDEIELREEGGD